MMTPNKKKHDNKEKLKKVGASLKKFFNNPAPIFIVFIAIIAFLLIYISRTNTKNTIFIGLIDKEDIQVVNVHYFTNNDVNYFYASNANFLAEDKKIYNFQIGYYVKNEKGDLVEFATRSRQLDSSTSLKEVVSEMSGWNFAEKAASDYFFTDEVIQDIENLHFIIKASTKKDSTEADVYYDYEVEMSKITK